MVVIGLSDSPFRTLRPGVDLQIAGEIGQLLEPHRQDREPK